MKIMMKLSMTLLCLTGIAAAQAGPQIPLSGSIGVPGSAPTLCSAAVVMPSDANFTLTANQFGCNSLYVTSSVSLTATRNIVAPLNYGQQFTVTNMTTGGQSIQVIGASGAGVIIANGNTLIINSPNGTNYVSQGGGQAGSITNNVLLNTPTNSDYFANTDSIGQTVWGGFPNILATLLGTPSGRQHIVAVGGASLADLLSCNNLANCTVNGTYPLTFPLGVTSNAKSLLEPAYNDLSNMGATPNNNQLSYYAGGLKAWMLEYAIPDSQKLAANGAYCTTTGTWTSVSAVPGGSGTFPAGTLETSTPGATITCTTHNATDAGVIGYKSTGSTTATFTVDVLNAGTTYHVADPYTGSTTLNQTAYYTSQWSATANLYGVGQSGMAGGYTTVTLTAANNSSDPVIVVAPYFISPSSGLQNFPAAEVMLESRAGCDGACSSIAGPLHNDSNTNIMRAAQIAMVNELRANGLNVSYFDPNATPSGYNSSDPTQTGDGTHPNSISAPFIANAAFVNLNSAATTQDHFLPSNSASGVSSVSNSDGTLTIAPTAGAVIASLNLAHANTWTASQNITAAGGAGISVTGTGSAASAGFALVAPSLSFAYLGWGTGNGAGLPGVTGLFDNNSAHMVWNTNSTDDLCGNTPVVNVAACSGSTWQMHHTGQLDIPALNLNGSTVVNGVQGSTGTKLLSFSGSTGTPGTIFIADATGGATSSGIPSSTLASTAVTNSWSAPQNFTQIAVTNTINNEPGLQVVSIPGCTMSIGALLNSCNVTITLSSPEPDTAYDVSGCSVTGAAAIAGNISSKSTTTFVVTEYAATASGASGGTVSCMVTHQ